MGPDEFHEKLPDSDEGGLSDNAYTNIMVVWCMERAFNILDQLEIEERKSVVEKISLHKEELVKWRDITSNIHVSVNEDHIIEQFNGYFDLKELDWDAYREKYDNIHRMDRILKAEGKSPDAYKVSKQADVLMTYFNLDESEVHRILKKLGHKVPEDMLKRNFDYYLARTSHGSTLSRVVHSYLAEMTGDEKMCWDLYLEALSSDYVDIQGGTTGEGIHVGVMGGTVLSAISVFGGLNWQGDALRIQPDLPGNWKEMKFNFSFRGGFYKFHITHEKIKVSYYSEKQEEVRIFIRGMKFVLNHRKEIEAVL